jgi:branched-chain amino acid transport system permease protein
VLYLAFGAVGAMGSLIAWQLINSSGFGFWPASVVAVLFGGAVTLAYGVVFGRALAARDPLVKATATLGLLLILLGVMDLLWPSSGGASRAIAIPTDNNTFQIGQISVTYTQVIALALGLVITAVTSAFLRFTKLGTAMRAMANDREITATLGVPVRRVTAAAWLGCGLLAGLAGVILADLVALDATALTFIVISTLAATLIGGLRSIWITFWAALVIGVVDAELTPINSVSNYRDATPFVLAAIALLWLNRKRVITVGRQGV